MIKTNIRVILSPAKAGGKDLIILASLILCSTPLFAQNAPFDPNKTMLPSPLPIYTNGQAASNRPAPSFYGKNLPTNNDYNLVPGCYITCYSHKKDQSVYAVGKDIYVIGQIRVGGNYEGDKCVPYPYHGKDISTVAEFKTLCGQTFPICGNGCWAGGATGYWFGLMPAETSSVAPGPIQNNSMPLVPPKPAK